MITILLLLHFLPVGLISSQATYSTDALGEIISRFKTAHRKYMPFDIYMCESWDFPARARVRRACALRALGLLLADSAPTVGRGKTFWRVNRFFFFTKTAVTPERKVGKSFPRWEMNGLQTGHWPKLASYGKNRIFWPKTGIFGPKKESHFCTLTMFWPRPEKVVQRKKDPLPK